MRDEQIKEIRQWCEKIMPEMDERTLLRLTAGSAGTGLKNGESGLIMSDAFQQQCIPSFNGMVSRIDDACSTPLDEDQKKHIKYMLEELYQMVLFMMVVRHRVEHDNEVEEEE